MTSATLPEKIGRYVVSRELGRGGMGVVYLAHDPFIDRSVAIKISTHAPVGEPEQLESFHHVFFNEARAAGKLVHPHIVSVHDAMAENNRCCLVMEYVDGLTLKENCTEKNLLPLDMASRIIFQCAKALEYAHQNGVIHRDIKPSNILISKEGAAKISDFGIAVVKGSTVMKGDESLTGSVHYTAPEQIQEGPLTPQADLFSLGVVMYELMTGKKPFEAETDIATIFKITNEDPKPIKTFRSDIPDSLERIVARALKKDPGKRYQTGLDLATDLSVAFDNLRYMDDGIKFEEKFNALKKIHFFKDFSSAELAEVLRDTQWLEYDSNDIIISEGEIDDCFFIIISGEVIVKKKEKILSVLKHGDCFGEMAYLGKIKRSATIQAVTKTVLMKINASIIEKTSMSTQLRFYRVFSNTLIRRLTHATAMLAKSPI